ncbi:ATP-binding cassette domain-containing protein [Microbacterium sp. No. 7]|uniref:ATP-binding cassette domain-containing protein n=1 Tax=Microbacterium sp. No. 7 TaxID=1714373 RepID=UPI0006D1FE36|nr:ATP-binding cassette domain-containing protein [Microbacterium sp. No. 7]ALJ21756.1 sugar ABC transporter ATP-binding protein [Microbacterium sp. No. 7]
MSRQEAAGPPLIELRNITKTFGAVRALVGVNLHVDAGEVVALVGDNGAGKSTLVKVISGVITPDSGEILFEGEPAHIASPADASGYGIETVYQDLSLCDPLDVSQNLFLGKEKKIIPWLGWLSPLDSNGMESRANDLLDSLGAVTIHDSRIAVENLSGGQRQSIAVARAVLWNSKVVLLDEPTAALGVSQTRQVLDLILRLREQGLGVILITHNMNDVFEVADRVAVLRLGQNAATFDIHDTNAESVIGAITGAEFGTERGQAR